MTYVWLILIDADIKGVALKQCGSPTCWVVIRYSHKIVKLTWWHLNPGGIMVLPLLILWELCFRQRT